MAETYEPYVDNPRRLWSAPLLEMHVRPWEMWDFTPREVENIKEMFEKRAQAAPA